MRSVPWRRASWRTWSSSTPILSRTSRSLYGTGAIKLNEDNEVERVGGVRYTIKDGIVFDAGQLLADVREIVRLAKEAEGFTLTQPGLGW